MTSWREEISEAAQDDLDGLVEPVWDFAEHQLLARGEFFPFAFVVGTDGEQSMAAAEVGDDKPESTEVIDVLNAGLTEKRDDLRATAVVADVHLPDLDTDAIRIVLEHREGVALEIMIPYRLQPITREVAFGELLVSEAERVVWGTPS
ncbi:MAG: hypothetical protein CVT62_06090 [Actinobacteria bacterium HGW-Actinobacteria-2]|nr:MAG: hypothetical protein CVT62_06090 [Actinobacteria bacterium HGW-Actinobacteria-2]